MVIQSVEEREVGLQDTGAIPADGGIDQPYGPGLLLTPGVPSQYLKEALSCASERVCHGSRRVMPYFQCSA
jgi:hypothetical protein